MIKIKCSGNFDKTTKFLGFLYRKEFLNKLKDYGEMGLAALRDATPVESGESAKAWDFYYQTKLNSVKLVWTNDNVTPEGTPIVILVQYGHDNHGTWYSGRDFINPAIQPIFDFIAEDIWKEVVNK